MVKSSDTRGLTIKTSEPLRSDCARIAVVLLARFDLRPPSYADLRGDSRAGSTGFRLKLGHPLLTFR